MPAEFVLVCAVMTPCHGAGGRGGGLSSTVITARLWSVSLTVLFLMSVWLRRPPALLLRAVSAGVVTAIDDTSASATAGSPISSRAATAGAAVDLVSAPASFKEEEEEERRCSLLIVAGTKSSLREEERRCASTDGDGCDEAEEAADDEGGDGGVRWRRSRHGGSSLRCHGTSSKPTASTDAEAAEARLSPSRNSRIAGACGGGRAP